VDQRGAFRALDATLARNEEPVRNDHPTFWPSWLLAFFVLAVVSIATMTIASVVLAPTRSVVLLIGVSIPLGWVLGNLAAARLLLKSSLRAGAPAMRPGVFELVRENWSRCGWAYAIAPIPVLVAGFFVSEFAEAIGGWVGFVLYFAGMLNGTISTVLIAGIGAAAIQAAMASLANSPQPVPLPPAP
jgi:hypothetical protein